MFVLIHDIVRSVSSLLHLPILGISVPKIIQIYLSCICFPFKLHGFFFRNVLGIADAYKTLKNLAVILDMGVGGSGSSEAPSQGSYCVGIWPSAAIQYMSSYCLGRVT